MERIYHDVTYKEDILGRPTLPQRVFDRVLFRNEKIIGQSSDQNTIKFLGRGAVEAAQSCLHVCRAFAELYGG